MVRGVATFSLALALGRAELHPELPAEVRGWKSAIDSADWIIVRVSHTLSNSGLTTNLDLEIKINDD